ncbi:MULTISPECIES: hypothetical protein [Saccharopolyspora]|uniref:hypothetical protein n=1 Tax=Saccharopolyspora TaxID=1835 RepID=UPI001CD406CD|nr:MULTISPECIES: hypothetical protein [Saccharopolyspora]MCA1190453.1 hypothetical protein [Saccharopolyspora sp. 6T]MCA1196290.1 hypothetical protein [Saccharopolyspora sp. 6V]MCA1228494.1 hypothetical protein [Saccharopolyspora sp. 6M]MCA1283337.1 hypothetical protein [Saccharopolyspora sp. 7B]
MAGFDVVIEALRGNVMFLQEAQDSWEEAHNKVKGKTLEEDDLGLLGKQGDIPGAYNGAAENLFAGLLKGVENLGKAAASLRAVVDDQAEREEEIEAELRKTQ